MKKTFTFAILCFAVVTANAQLIKNDFLSGYTTGQNLEKGSYANSTQGEGTPIQLNQWNLSGKTGNNDQSPESASPKVVAPLTYPGYSESGKDVAIELLKLSTGGRTDIYSLANDNTYGAGTYYLAFLSNVSTASTSAAEFISLDGNYTGNAQRARYTIKGIDETTYQVGLGDSGAASAFFGTFNFNQTYLAVLKVTLDGEGAGTAWLYINPDLTQGEPATAFATVSITGTALKAIRGVVIRQRSTLAANLSGIRLAKSWADAIGGTETGISVPQNQANSIQAVGKTIVSNQTGKLEVYNLAGATLINQAISGGLQTNLAQGVYVARFTGEQGNVSTSKIVIK